MPIALRAFGAFAGAVLTVAAATAARSADQPDPALAVYGHPQQLVDIGGRRLNLYCLGQGSPTVILVGGLGSSTFSWRKVHAELAKTTRVCAYDRAGYGYSDPGPLPRDMRHLADDLAALTKAARLRPPYVLVGASIGGMIARHYADTRLDQVGGMVLVDPETEHEERRLEPVSPGFFAKLKAQSEVVRACLTATEAGAPTPGSKAATCVITPSPEYPPEVNAHFTETSSHPAFYRESLSEEEEAWGAGSDQVAAAKRSYGDRPLIVLTSSSSDRPDPSHPDPYFDARTQVVVAMHREVAQLSSRGSERLIPGATHQIMLSVPQAVIDAVNEVVAEVRQGRAAPPPRR